MHGFKRAAIVPALMTAFLILASWGCGQPYQTIALSADSTQTGFVFAGDERFGVPVSNLRIAYDPAQYDWRAGLEATHYRLFGCRDQYLVSLGIKRESQPTSFTPGVLRAEIVTLDPRGRESDRVTIPMWPLKDTDRSCFYYYSDWRKPLVLATKRVDKSRYPNHTIVYAFYGGTIQIRISGTQLLDQRIWPPQPET